MQRFLPLIVALFTLASIWGGASGYAIAYSSDVPDLAIAASGDDFCLVPTAESDPVVSFKACGKKKTGIVMPCSGHPGIIAEQCDIGFDAAREGHAAVTGRFVVAWPIQERLKPPIAG